MWFAVGLVSLCVILAYQFRYRWHRPWTGQQASTGMGIRHQYRYLSHKDNTFAVEVGVPVPDFFRFELKRETWVDRFFKWVGLSVEKQFGHDGFDRLVYVASNDEHLFNRVADSPELRQAAQRIFVQIYGGCRVQRVSCAHGQLVARIRRAGIFSSKEDVARLGRCMALALPFLDELGKALRASPPPTVPAPQRDRFLLPAVAVLSVSTALAINGLLFLLRPILFEDAFLLDKSRIFELTLWLGTFIFLGLLAAHTILLARSARAHLFLLELLLVGSFGAYTTAASELRDANIEWDVSPVTVREAAVVDKSISRSRRGGTRYYLHVRDWETAFDTRSIKVSRSFYDSMDKGRLLVFEERAGYFQARWARLVGPKPQEPSSR